MTLVKIILYLVIMAPGQPPAWYHKEMATLTDCLMEEQEILEDNYRVMQDPNTTNRVVQIGCFLVKNDRPA